MAIFFFFIVLFYETVFQNYDQNKIKKFQTVYKQIKTFFSRKRNVLFLRSITKMNSFSAKNRINGINKIDILHIPLKNLKEFSIKILFVIVFKKFLL